VHKNVTSCGFVIPSVRYYVQETNQKTQLLQSIWWEQSLHVLNYGAKIMVKLTGDENLFGWGTIPMARSM